MATSFVIAVHALALLVVFLPLAKAPDVGTGRDDTAFRWELPPEICGWVPGLEKQPPRVTPPRTQPTPVPTPAIVDQGTLQAEPSVEMTAPPNTTPDIGAPLQGAQLRYAVAPPPRYPRDALASGAEGTVLLRVWVDVDGAPLEVVVERSSGHRSLDREAVRHVLQRWRFEPAVRDGRPAQAWGLVPIDFSLQ